MLQRAASSLSQWGHRRRSCGQHGLLLGDWSRCGSANGFIRPIDHAVIGGNQQKRRLGEARASLLVVFVSCLFSSAEEKSNSLRITITVRLNAITTMPTTLKSCSEREKGRRQNNNNREQHVQTRIIVIRWARDGHVPLKPPSKSAGAQDGPGDPGTPLLIFSPTLHEIFWFPQVNTHARPVNAIGHDTTPQTTNGPGIINK